MKIVPVQLLKAGRVVSSTQFSKTRSHFVEFESLILFYHIYRPDTQMKYEICRICRISQFTEHCTSNNFLSINMIISKQIKKEEKKPHNEHLWWKQKRNLHMVVLY